MFSFRFQPHLKIWRKMSDGKWKFLSSPGMTPTVPRWAHCWTQPTVHQNQVLTFYMKSIHIEVDHRSFWLLDILSQRFPSLKLDIWIPFSDTEFNLCSFFVTDQQASLCSSFVLSENLQLMHPTSLVTDKFLQRPFSFLVLQTDWFALKVFGV